MYMQTVDVFKTCKQTADLLSKIVVFKFVQNLKYLRKRCGAQSLIKAWKLRGTCTYQPGREERESNAPISLDEISAKGEREQGKPKTTLREADATQR